MDFHDASVKRRGTCFLGQSSNRHPVEVLRVRYWYEGIKKKTSCSTAYQLERLIEPLTAPSTDVRTPFRNKWIRYEKGKHTPRSSMLKKVENRVIGSTRELNHPLWKILLRGDQCADRVDVWIKELEPRVQMSIFRYMDNSVSTPNVRLPFSSVVGRRLVKLASLDALTALLLYWLESYQRGNREEMQVQATDIYKVLLMMGMDFYRRHIAEELFLIFRETVFERTDWEDSSFAIDETLYVRGVHLLHYLLFDVNDKSPFSSRETRCRAMYQILEGKRGLDKQFGLGILLKPNWIAGPPTKQQWINARCRYMFWLWGWTHLNRGTEGLAPYDELWDTLQRDWAASPALI